MVHHLLLSGVTEEEALQWLQAIARGQECQARGPQSFFQGALKRKILCGIPRPGPCALSHLLAAILLVGQASGRVLAGQAPNVINPCCHRWLPWPGNHHCIRYPAQPPWEWAHACPYSWVRASARLCQRWGWVVGFHFAPFSAPKTCLCLRLRRNS